MTLPARSRPSPASVIDIRRRDARQAPPPVIYGRDLTEVDGDEPTFMAELRWTAACIALGVAVPMLLIAAIAGPAAAWWPLRDALRQVFGLAL